MKIISADKIKNKYPNRIPIILNKHNKSQIVELTKTKYLVPYDMTVAQFAVYLIQYLRVQSDYNICLYVKNHLIDYTQQMGNVYSKHQHASGFLYLTYGTIDDNQKYWFNPLRWIGY